MDIKNKEEVSKMAKKNFKELSRQILSYVGGKDNISYFVHCATRLRFNVRNKRLVKEEEIKKQTEYSECNGRESSCRSSSDRMLIRYIS